ncbi:MAG: putative MFS-type transporter YcaD [Chlamydiia bacterium]|nr:putative MFS-type transporter YcaD [Chlamydiia bacterium]
MKATYKQVIAPIASLALIMLGQGFFNTYVSVKLNAVGYSTSLNGLVNACYFLGIMIGGIYIEKFINNIGHIRAFAIFASMNAAIVTLQSLFISIWSWMLLRCLMGICAAGLFIVIESWLLLLSTTKTRGKLLSLYMVGLYLAQASGQFILNIVDISTQTPFMTSIFLSSISVIPVCVMRSGSPQVTEEASVTNIFHIFKICPFGVLGCFIAGMILSAFYSLGPVFARESSLSIMQVSQIMGITIFGGLALQWPIGHLSDIIDRLKVLLIVALILLGISLILFINTTMSYWLFLLLCLLFGGFSFTLYPLSITFTCDHFNSNNIISITCSLLIVYGTGSILGPLISPLLMLIKPSGLFLYVSILSLLLIFVGILKVRRKAEISEEEQGEYIPLPRTTPLAYYLDPRQEEKDDDALEEYLFQSDEEHS